MDKIWILVYKDRMNSYENKKLKEEIIKNNLEKYIKFIYPQNISIKNKENINQYYYYEEQKKDFFLYDKPQKVMVKIGCSINNYDIKILETLKMDGVKLINDIQALIDSSEKYKTINKLNNKKIKTIKTQLVNGYNAQFLNTNNFKYPSILKSNKGSLGIGIYKINNNNEMKNLINQIALLDEKYEFLIQEYIKEGNSDYRVFVLGNDISFVMKRTAKTDEFRANFSLGASVELIKSNEKIENIVKLIKKEFKLNIMGIDLFKVDDEYIVCEINSNPGFNGYDKIIKEGFAKKYLEFLINYDE